MCPGSSETGSPTPTPLHPWKSRIWVEPRLWADFGVRGNGDFSGNSTGPPPPVLRLPPQQGEAPPGHEWQPQDPGTHHTSVRSPPSGKPTGGGLLVWQDPSPHCVCPGTGGAGGPEPPKEPVSCWSASSGAYPGHWERRAAGGRGWALPPIPAPLVWAAGTGGGGVCLWDCIWELSVISL